MYLNQKNLGGIYYFKIAVALAVAAIPEGLSVIITTCLALGTQKMASQGAIVRKLQSVETLGCTSVICSDKTGTLTTNQMSVRRALVARSKSSFDEFTVDGNTYGPEGQVYNEKKTALSFPAASNSLIAELSHICSLCNDSQILYDNVLDTYTRIGEPTEAALLAFVEKVGCEDETVNASAGPIKDIQDLDSKSVKEKKERCSRINKYIASLYTRTHLLEFSRDRKSMSVVVEKQQQNASPFKSGKTRSSTAASANNTPLKQRYLYCKGAPESVLERCTHYKVSADSSKAVPLTAALRESILSKVATWAGESLRVLAFAVLEDPDVSEKIDASEFIQLENGMTFVGLVGMLDPPRPEVKEAIEKCKCAGIRVIVITGDNKKTAENICRQIGVFEHDEEVKGKSFTGREFDLMSEKEKLDAVLNANLFARTEPAHKSELVDLLKKQGFIVAMVCSLLCEFTIVMIDW